MEVSGQLHASKRAPSTHWIGVWVGTSSSRNLFSSPPCPDQLWNPPNHLCTGYQELFWG